MGLLAGHAVVGSVHGLVEPARDLVALVMAPRELFLLRGEGGAHAPTYAAKRETSGAHTLYASWNVATQVAGWRVLAGRNPAAMQPVAAAARSGFETAIAVPAQVTGPAVTVQALDASGAVIGTATPATLG